MKIRSGFVSNSSSCSFIVKDAASFVNSINDIAGNDIPYDMMSLNVTLCGSKKDIDAISNDIAERNGDAHSKESIFKSWTDDNMFELRCSFSELLNASSKLLSKVQYVMLDADDCNVAEMLDISILYKLAQALGLNPDASDSDNDMLFDEKNTSGIGRLIQAAFSKNIAL